MAREEDFDIIDEEYRMKYAFLIYCDNLLVSILDASIKEKWCDVSLTLKEKDIKKWNNSKYNLEYFRTHGYNKEINTMYYRRTLFCLLADFWEYLANSIECIGKRHINSAYTLLRKPLKDDLLFVEMLSSQGHWFVGRFIKGKIEKYAVEGIRETSKKRMIKKVCKEVQMPTYNNLLYNFRYNKKVPYGLEGLWNRTSHIITTYKSYRTEDGNLNMIFNGEQNEEKLLEYYFKVVPLIYSYTLRVCINILYRENLINKEEYFMNMLVLTLKTYATINEKHELDENLRKSIFICPHCLRQNKIEEAFHSKDSFLHNQSGICSNCNEKIRLDKILRYN